MYKILPFLIQFDLQLICFDKFFGTVASPTEKQAIMD